MPYYIFRIGPLRVLSCTGEAASYAQAKAAVTELRASLDAASGDTVRMVFADNELAAAELLSQTEPAPPRPGEDD